MDKNNKDSNVISIYDAMDTLSSISDLEIDDEGKVYLPPPGAPRSAKAKNIAKKVARIQDEAGEISIAKVKALFHVVLEHLKNIYEKTAEPEEAQIEQIKALMVVVGEAAKKLDRMTTIFQKIGGTNHLEEYKELQNFYSGRIERKVNETMLSRWILGLAGTNADREQEEAKKLFEESKHVFVDLDMVRNDTEYELLLMRKEDGSRFFSPRLLRNIKLVCDFGGYIEDAPQNDVFEEIQDWREQVAQRAAVNLIKALAVPMKRFYQDAFKYKEKDMVASLNMCLMALMCAANPRHLKPIEMEKGCADYFNDFQFFLRELLGNRFYQKLLVYPPDPTHLLSCCLLEVTNGICKALYMNLDLIQELYSDIEHLLNKIYLDQGKKKVDRGLFIWSRLAFEFNEMMNALKVHGNGPLKRVLEELEEGRLAAFDPLMQFNLPHPWFTLSIGDWKGVNVRMASPTRQVMINKAAVNDEYKGMLLSKEIQSQKMPHLLISLQDRTSWREGPRCQALEQLQNHPDFKSKIVVVTLDVDSEFYHQTGKFVNLDQTSTFIKTFKAMLIDDDSGFYFPNELREHLSHSFFQNTLSAVHSVFFDEKELLSKSERQDFIQIFYSLLEVKLLELIQPVTFSLSCKDGIDLSSSHAALLFLMVRLLQQQKLSEFDWECIDLMVYGPALLIRERAMLTDPFNRMLGALKTVETIEEKKGVFAFSKAVHEKIESLFEWPILKATIEFNVKPIDKKFLKAA